MKKILLFTALFSSSALAEQVYDHGWPDHCLDGNTVIELVNGDSMPISKLSEGDLVATPYGYDDVDFFVANEYEGDILVITLEGGEKILATPEHPFLVNGMYTAARNLKQGTYVEAKSGSEKVTDISVKLFEGIVYNIVVNPDPNQDIFFANGIQVGGIQAQHTLD